MAIYAIGDVQGCAKPLEALLEKIKFDPAKDQIWLAGDLVNRGPDSLRTLRLVKSLGESAVTVLGNHDLHLLAVACGVKKLKHGDTLKPILGAADRDELVHWLRHLPLLHSNQDIRTLMTHAGVYPGWTHKELTSYAREVEAILQSEHHVEFFENMYGKTPTKWDDALIGWDRLRFITNSLTRMRYCDKQRHLEFSQKGAIADTPEDYIPWFRHPQLKCQKWQIVFGHWSTLGFYRENNVIGLDSGCVWGGKLTAIKLTGKKAGKVWQLDCG